MSLRKPQVVIVSSGSEITNGKSLDTNSGWIANEMVGLGFSIRQFVTLPDDPRVIREELSRFIQENSPSKGAEAELTGANLEEATSRTVDPQTTDSAQKPTVDWIVMTGGLGPTEDDCTVDCVCRILGTNPVIVEEAKAKLELVYRRRGRVYEELLPTVVRQTRVPETARVLHNAVGIAPGFVVELGRTTKLACMPGVPPEMREMFHKELVPLLLTVSGRQTRHRLEKYLWNMGESLFQEEFVKNHPLLDGSGVEWGVTAKRGYIKVTFFSENEDTIRQLELDLETRYRERISGDVFAELHEILTKENNKIAVAESCTGGWLGKAISDQPGSSAYFIASLVTYHNQAKENLLFVPQDSLIQFGAVSVPTAKEMLAGLEKHFDIDYAVSITGIAGPGGGSDEKPVGTVFIGIKKRGSKPRVIKFHFPGNREIVREAAVNNALFLLYKEVTQ